MPPIPRHCRGAVQHHSSSVWFRWVATVWFLVHIPITMFIDAQIVLPAYLFPTTAVQLCDWYVGNAFDPLVRAAPAWFRGLVWCEVLLQLPFFCVAAYAYGSSLSIHRPCCEWIQLPSVVYGGHTCTTLVPILAELWNSPSVPTSQHRQILTAIYMPYLVFPLIIGCYEYRNLRLAMVKSSSATSVSVNLPTTLKNKRR